MSGFLSATCRPAACRTRSPQGRSWSTPSYAERLELGLGQLHRRRGERVVGRRVGRGQLLVRCAAERRDVVHERHELVRDRQRHVERVVVGLVGLACRTPTGAPPAPSTNAYPLRAATCRGGRGQQRGERPEGQVDVVGVDQRLVVGDDLVGVALVIQDRQLDLAAEDAARRVDVLDPQVVALLEGLAVGGEVAGQGEGRTDGDRRGDDPLADVLAEPVALVLAADCCYCYCCCCCMRQERRRRARRRPARQRSWRTRGGVRSRPVPPSSSIMILRSRAPGASGSPLSRVIPAGSTRRAINAAKYTPP